MEELRAGLQPVDGQRAEHQRRDHVAGDAKRQRRDHRGGIVGIVAAFRRRHALRIALAEARRVIRGILGRIVTEEGRDIAARAGQDADADADARGAQPGGQQAAHLAGLEGYVGQLQLCRRQPLEIGLFGQLQHGRQRVEPHQHHDQVEPAQKPGLAEGEPCLPREVVDPQGADQEPQHRGHDALDRVGADHDADRGHAEDRDPEVLGRTEEQRHACQKRSDGHQGDGAGDAAHGRRPAGDLQGLGGFALVGHREAVEGGGDRGGRAGNAQQDRRDRAAIHRSVVDARHHGERHQRVHRIGQRQQKRDGHHRVQPRQRADEDTQQRGADHRRQRPEGQDVGKRVGIEFHIRLRRRRGTKEPRAAAAFPTAPRRRGRSAP